MKSGKKNQKKKQQMKKRKKINVLGEIIYNCPYLLAVVISSLVVMVCSDKIGIKAIASGNESAVHETVGSNVVSDESATDTAFDSAQMDGENLENMDKNELEEMENAGERKGENDDIANETEHENDIEINESTENTGKVEIGVTKYEFYEPQETDSYYYSDAGKTALTTEYPYTKENVSYFNDAIFIGDSRTLGISDYAGLDEADFYCDSGMTVLKLLDAGGVTYQKTGKKEDLNQVLQQKRYGKIYIMLGMNDLGYGNTDMYLERYRKIVDQFREWQPDAIIYIMANLHVSRAKNNPETEFNNININDKNAASASLANGTDIFYLDANPLFTDDEGFLNAELTFDGVHLYAQHYDVWREFLLEHAVESKHTDTTDSSMMNQVPNNTES